MSEDRIARLWERYADIGDTEARDELFEEYLPLSRAVARRFIGRGAELEDLEQVAGMALLSAMKRYDAKLGNRFTTYAVPTMAGALRNHLRDKGSLIRVPRDAQQKLYRMAREQERFEGEFGRTPSASELASRMELTPDELLMLVSLREQNDAVSLDSPVGDNATIGELVAGEDNSFDRFEQGEWMRWILNKVNDTERKLLMLRYEERLGQRETASRMGISQMQVSRLERRVLTRLRAMEHAAE